MANVYEQAAAFRQQLLARDRQAAAQLIRGYGAAYKSMQGEIDRLAASITRAVDAGVPRSALTARMYREGRLRILQEKVLGEIGKYAREAEVVVLGAIGDATKAGATEAAQLLRTALPEGITIAPAAVPGVVQPVAAAGVALATGAVETFAGVAQPEAAVGRLLAQLGPQAATAVTDGILSGIAMGQNPKVIARGIRDALGGNLTRALTIARTETMRAYREASRAEYAANTDVLEGWTWVADLGSRTCPSCIAQHGSVHKVTEVMATHPRCRCAMAPLSKSWGELGFGDQRELPRGDTGPQWFGKQPEGTQRAILGPAKYAAYKSKQITLADTVARSTSPVWGPSTGEASLSATRAAAKARRRAR